MAKGPKGNLDNVSALPLHDEPQAVHYAKSDELRPADLTDAEAEIWNRIGPYLALLGRLKPHYVDFLAEYCRVIVRMAETRRHLDKYGWSYTSEGRNGSQEKMRPEVGQLNDDWRKLRSMVGEFGLAPAAERALKGLAQGDMFDGFEEF